MRLRRQQRLLADDIDQAARLVHAVEHGRGAFQHLDALAGGGEVARLNRAHAVAQDRAVAVIAETALDQRILRAAQRIGLSNAADKFYRVVEILRVAVLQYLPLHHGDVLRRIDNLCRRARGGHAAVRLIAIFLRRCVLRDQQRGFLRVQAAGEQRAAQQERREVFHCGNWLQKVPDKFSGRKR